MTEHTAKPGMLKKALIVVGLTLVVGAAIVAKTASREESPAVIASQVANPAAARGADANLDPNAAQDPVAQARPRLVDLGAGRCIPCKMMAPILDELNEEYQGVFDVVFIDVWEDKAAGEPYNIRVIPTQIFFDADGKELFRHEGFYSKEDILVKWAELGVDLEVAASAT